MELCHNLIEAVKIHAKVLEQNKDNMVVDIEISIPAVPDSHTSSPLTPPISPKYSTSSSSSSFSSTQSASLATGKMSVDFMLNRGHLQQHDQNQKQQQQYHHHQRWDSPPRRHHLDQGNIECASVLASLCYSNPPNPLGDKDNAGLTWRLPPPPTVSQTKARPGVLMAFDHKRPTIARMPEMQPRVNSFAHTRIQTRAHIQPWTMPTHAAKLVEKAHVAIAAIPSAVIRLPIPTHIQASANLPSPLSERQDDHAAKDRASRPKGSAKQYSDEECDFALYHYVDKGLPWEDVVVLFNKQFPPSAGEQRTRMGIQARYYRNNKRIPVMGQSGLAAFDANGRRREESCKVREQTQKKGRRIGLLDSFPERAMFYSWVDEGHRRLVEPRGRVVLRQIQNSAAMNQRKRAGRRR